MNYKYTRIWRVEHKLIIADTIDEAIEVYRAWCGSIGSPKDITNIKAVGDSQIPENFDALIKC